MNILRVSTLSLLLAIAVFALGYANPSFAGKKCDADSGHPSCKDGAGGQPKNDTSDCQIDFSVTFGGPESGDVILGVAELDGSLTYPDPDDPKDKSGGGTSAGPGFRFDTNGKGPLESAHDSRFLEINPVSVPDFGSKHVSGADFRFHLPFGGLDLCNLNEDEFGNVPMTLGFVDDGGTEWVLLYDCIFHDTNPIDDEDKGPVSRDQVTVTRTKGAAGGWTKGDTWTITGTDACLISGNNYATAIHELEDEDISADFEMTIEAQ